MSKKQKRAVAEKILFQKEEYLKTNDKLRCRYQFLEKFTLCEICCKAILKEYKKNNKTFSSEKNLKLDMREIPAALKFAGYSIEEEILRLIFAGSGNYTKRGCKSAKQLRNGIVHNLSESDIEEVCKRYTCLCATMDSFLNYFRKEIHASASRKKHDLPHKHAA